MSRLYDFRSDNVFNSGRPFCYYYYSFFLRHFLTSSRYSTAAAIIIIFFTIHISFKHFCFLKKLVEEEIGI